MIEPDEGGGSDMSDRGLYRLGSASAVLGAILALVTNLIHPRLSDYDDPVGETLREVAESGGWIPIHLGLLLGSLLIVVGLFAVARSMKGGPADGLARLALGSLLVSAPVAVMALAVDGYATKQVAEAAAGGEAGFAAGAAVVHVAWALFMALVILFVGVTPALFGLAVARSGIYPSWLGWGAVILGLVAVIVGVMGTLDGASAAFFVSFTVASGLLTLWVLAIGVLLGRRAAMVTA
jgi:hypothetical protein